MLSFVIGNSFCLPQILNATQRSLLEIGSGKVVSLVSKDLKPIHTFVKRFPYVFIAPMQMLVLAILLWQLVGVAALTGMLYLLFIGFYLLVTYKPLKRLRKETSKFTAMRLTQIENTINAVRLVKMSTWEKHFQSSIGKVRRYEELFTEMTSQNKNSPFPLIQLLLTQFRGLKNKNCIKILFVSG